MSRAKDKKIVDAYMRKHPNATPKQIEEYASKKGIHINVMPNADLDAMRDVALERLGIDPKGFDPVNNKDDKAILEQAILTLPLEEIEHVTDVLKHHVH